MTQNDDSNGRKWFSTVLEARKTLKIIKYVYFQDYKVSDILGPK
jgi:hypothetical protein